MHPWLEDFKKVLEDARKQNDQWRTDALHGLRAVFLKDLYPNIFNFLNFFMC